MRRYPTTMVIDEKSAKDCHQHGPTRSLHYGMILSGYKLMEPSIFLKGAIIISGRERALGSPVESLFQHSKGVCCWLGVGDKLMTL